MKRPLAHAHVANRNLLLKRTDTRSKTSKDFDSSIPSLTHADKLVPSSLVSDIDSCSRMSPMPPSYKSTPFTSVLPIAQKIEKKETNRSNSPFELVLPVKQAASQIKEGKNLDDAWKNIKMEQDEQYADRFRNDMLLARCWEMWRQGFQWIMVSVLMMR